MTTSISSGLTLAETIFKNLVWTPLIVAGETALFTSVPILDAPVLGAIDKEVISLISDYLFDKLILFIDVTAIQFINADHQSQYDSASEALKVIAQEKGMDSAEFLQAQATAIKQMQAFTSFTGSDAS